MRDPTWVTWTCQAVPRDGRLNVVKLFLFSTIWGYGKVFSTRFLRIASAGLKHFTVYCPRSLVLFMWQWLTEYFNILFAWFDLWRCVCDPCVSLCCNGVATDLYLVVCWSSCRTKHEWREAREQNPYHPWNGHHERPTLEQGRVFVWWYCAVTLGQWPVSVDRKRRDVWKPLQQLFEENCAGKE